MADSINCEVTVSHVENHLEVMPEFWADRHHQYGIFWLEWQTLLSGDSGGTWREAAVFAGLGMTEYYSNKETYMYCCRLYLDFQVVSVCIDLYTQNYNPGQNCWDT